jgi:hypothetical protein
VRNCNNFLGEIAGSATRTPIITAQYPVHYVTDLRAAMWRKGEKRIFAHSFQPAASPKALKRIGRTVRSWALHHRSDLSLTELAAKYNPCRSIPAKVVGRHIGVRRPGSSHVSGHQRGGSA